MSKRIAFLRAVNVGKRTVPMAQLARVCEELGYADVHTHVNSGNVVFDASGSRAAIACSMAELRAMLRFEPFSVADGDTYFVTFLKGPPPAATAAALEAASNGFDTLVVHGRDVHWRMRGKSTDTTVPRATWNLFGRLGSTSRNVNMLRKLVAKFDD